MEKHGLRYGAARATALGPRHRLACETLAASSQAGRPSWPGGCRENDAVAVCVPQPRPFSKAPPCAWNFAVVSSSFVSRRILLDGQRGRQGALARSRSRGGLTDGSAPHPAWTKLASMADVTPPWGSYLFSPGPKVADARFHACAPGACRCGCVCLCAVATRCPARSRSRRSLTDGCAPNPAAVCGRPVSRAPTTRRPLPRL